MTNTMIVEGNKDFLKTTFRPIYQAENYADEVQILISPDFFEYVSDSIIFLQVILPPDEEGKRIGKIKILSVDDELYKGYYRVTFPISTAWTKYRGMAFLWLSMYHAEGEGEQAITRLIQTNRASINIMTNAILDSGDNPPIDDDILKILDELQKSVEELKENKMDAAYDYNEDDNTIQFYCEGMPYGQKLELDKEVTWERWS